ncbi:hypothetical protein GCM10010176_077380 [Nonomuraea spiralis]|nr:hypothetical protein GCM10010176_077380 [Nonomuraea spiralis]
MASTRQSEREAPPWVGEAKVVMTPLGVSERRESASRMTDTFEPLKIGNYVVYIVNQVVYRVK